MSCKIVEKRTPWSGPGRQIKHVVVQEKPKKPKTCNCHKLRGKHARGDCHGS